MDELPLVLEKIILQRVYEMERHLKFKKCLNEIDSIDYVCNNDIASCRTLSPYRSTNYFIENNIELWIHKHIDNKQYISTIYDCYLFIDIINNNCIIHSL